ncbi:UNVERIFIED_CONTAM: hypothetical protein Slati_3924600 [Sesamum latifolium]|uniref:Retrotransposon gag domain-containing protein n=1 Tax=Sesamum latifolium TaxID=2727402 RepID=A0AAW2TND5_9LAMI
MVTTWILNSISRKIVEGFMYTKSSRRLWLDLEERYGQCNGPQLYQLRCEITVLSQENMTVEAYYAKLRRLWDELEVLMSTTLYLQWLYLWCIKGGGRSSFVYTIDAVPNGTGRDV